MSSFAKRTLSKTHGWTMDNHLLEDFPVDWQEDNYVSRREFVKFLTLASGGLAAGSVGLAAWSKCPPRKRVFDRAEIGAVDELPVGGWKQFSYPRPIDACILVRTGDSSVVAFSRKCTHLSCPVGWQPENNRLYCPCHNGAFSIEDGHVLQGPPDRPLPRIILELEDGKIFATGVTNESL